MLTETVSDEQVGEPKRILFVDDDQDLLEGLRDALRPYRRAWSMRFLTSGDDALAMLATEPCDVLVSDLRMPGIDGSFLLERTREICPAAVRIVLSGQADLRMVARAAAAAHRLIAKPCDTDELARVIERSCALQQLAARVELDRRAIGASALPSVPSLYAELTELLSSGTAGAADAARIIERDIAMAAKVLQLANSAYFGRRSPVTKVSDAVAYLGVDTLRTLLLHAEAFREFQVKPSIPGFDIEQLHQHCARVARLASTLLTETGVGGEALAAGLLHDVGLLVLASRDRDGLADILARARHERCPIHKVEKQQHGVTHAEIGAHLLALWGLPHSVTEAVAGHHDNKWLGLPFDTVAAVQVATALVEELEAQQLPEACPASELDLDYLERAELATQLPRWRELAAGQFHGDIG